MSDQSDQLKASEKALNLILADTSLHHFVFQPIVDLQHGVIAGYEALSRFEGFSSEALFKLAHAYKVDIQIELRILEKIFAVRDTLPKDTFLSVNIGPNAFLDKCTYTLLDKNDCSKLVFELTEHEPINDYVFLKSVVDVIRRNGGFFAIDDAGAGYASLRHILKLRPDFIKLDRGFLENDLNTELGRGVVRLLGELGDQVDAWIIAEGIEHLDQLDALVTLQVPLGQGYCLAHPTPTWVKLPEAIVEHLQERSRTRSIHDLIVRLIEQIPVLIETTEHSQVKNAFETDSDTLYVIAVDHRKCPRYIYRREDHDMDCHIPQPILTVTPTVPIAEALRLALRRPRQNRFDPIVCCRTSGPYVGMVYFERLIEHLISE